MSENKPITSKIFLPITIVIVFWVLEIIDVLIFSGGLDRFGIIPRSIPGLLGIVAAPFLHGNFAHLIANTIPFLVLSLFISFFYHNILGRSLALISLISGALVWLLAGLFDGVVSFIFGYASLVSIHIGASSVIYGMTSFLIASGIFRKNPRSIVIAVLIFFLYGGIILGALPFFVKAGVSWEGHLFGAIAGVLVAYIFRREEESA